MIVATFTGNSAQAGSGGRGGSSFTGGLGGQAEGGALRNLSTMPLTNILSTGSFSVVHTINSDIDNSTFTSNTATGGNGGADGNTPGDAGSADGGALANLGTLSLNSDTFDYNTATGGTGTSINGGGGANGGGVCNGDYYTFLASTPASYAATVVLTITASAFTGNQAVGIAASGEGGGFENYQGTVNAGGTVAEGMTDGLTFTDNQAVFAAGRTEGGGFETSGGLVIGNWLTFTNNSANKNGPTGYGGAIYVSSGSTVTLTDCMGMGDAATGSAVFNYAQSSDSGVFWASGVGGYKNNGPGAVK